MKDDQLSKVIHSDLETSHSQGSYSVSIQIYRSTDSSWTLEVVAVGADRKLPQCAD